MIMVICYRIQYSYIRNCLLNDYSKMMEYTKGRKTEKQKYFYANTQKNLSKKERREVSVFFNGGGALS